MKLNRDFFKNMWPFTPEQEEAMIRKAKDDIIRKESEAIG